MTIDVFFSSAEVGVATSVGAMRNLSATGFFLRFTLPDGSAFAICTRPFFRPFAAVMRVWATVSSGRWSGGISSTGEFAQTGVACLSEK